MRRDATSQEEVRQARRPVKNHRLRQWLERVGGGLVGLVATAGLIIVLNPAKVGAAMTRFQLTLIPAIFVLYLGIYALQGLRWHYLLRDAGVRLRVQDSILVNAAGQTITALVPLGDLTRAAFAAEASGVGFGTIAATVTVQELSYNLMLVLCALPVVLQFQRGVVVVVCTLVGMAGIVVILTVSRVFHAVHKLVARIPLLNRMLPAIDQLQHETAELLHRPDALGLTVLDLARAAVTITAFWVLVQGVSPGTIDWPKAGFVLAISSIGGAISLIPGGVGANEASVAGLLIVFGVDGGAAGAAALMQRVLMTGTAVVFGVISYALVQRRLHLGGIFELAARGPTPGPAG